MADVFDCIYNIGVYLWNYKIQILGSLFVTLTIFEYFYRRYLRTIREKQKLKLKRILNEIMLAMESYNRHDSEHEVLALSVDNLSKEIEENNRSVHTKIDANQRVLLTKLEADAEVRGIEFRSLSKTVGNTIKRIDLLEQDTHPLRTIRKYKKAAFLALIGLIITLNGKGIYLFFEGFFNNIKDKIFP